MRADYTAVLFILSGLVSFNAGIWQIFRRGQKRQLLENHKNIHEPPLHTLPADDVDANKIVFRRVELEGTFDNNGSCLVGPRGIQSYKGAAHSDESRGGFLILTPFEVANTKQNIMVSRGWVPIDACKHRLMLTQYTGEGFAPATVRGILRKEEYLGGSFWRGERPENGGPIAADLSWVVIRPWNMAMDYYRRRWGADKVSEVVQERGLHHYYVEMLEDYSGDDQRLVRDRVWPRRRDVDEVTYVHLTPVVHTMYILFWFSITAGSAYGVRKCWQRQKEIFALRRLMQKQNTMLYAQRQQEAAAYAQAVKDVERLQGRSAAGRAVGRSADEAHTTTKSGEMPLL